MYILNVRFGRMPPPKKRVSRGESEKKTSPGPPDSNVVIGTKEFFAAEDELVDGSTAEEDAELFHKTTEKLLAMFAKYRVEAKNSADTKGLEKMQVDVLMSIMRLRRLNRLSHFRNKKIRDQVTEERLKVEEQYLQLQNLLYEVSHIEKEVEKCLEFKSDHEDIEMIPVDQFYKEAPESISKLAATKNDAHAQRLARLNWELETRKKLEAELEKVEIEKAEFLKQIDSAQGQLSTMQPKLEALLEASRPLQEALDMPYEKEAIQRQYAAYLPSCLYHLYIQALAYKEVFDRHFGVCIEGDIDRVKKLIAEKRNEASANDDSETDDSESDVETKKHENQHHAPSKSGRQRRKTLTDLAQEQEPDVLDPFPLHVELKATYKGKATIYLKFFYIDYLGVIGVKSRLELMADVPRALATANGLLSDDTMLAYLFSGDAGLTCPNPTGRMKLDYSKLDLNSKIDVTGRVYEWAQRVAGLVFPSSKRQSSHDGDNNLKDQADEGEGTSAEQSESRDDVEDGCQFFQTVLQRIKKRVVARLSLQEQFALFEALNINPPKEVSSWFPSRIHSRMTQWSSMTFDDFICHAASKSFRETVNEEGWFCTILVERGPVTLTALIHVPVDYPLTAPMFCPILSRKGTKLERSIENCSDLWHLARAVNLECVRRIPTSVSNYTLLIQLQFLISRVDVLLEIQSAEQGNKEFPMEHLFQSFRKGRDRQLPVWYNEKRNCYTFECPSSSC